MELLVWLLCSNIADEPFKWQLASRYSARISFIIFFFLALQISKFGIRDLWNSRKGFLSKFIWAFGVNHFLHFVFIVIHFSMIDWDFNLLRQGFGFIVYLMLPFSILMTMKSKKLTPLIYWFLQIQLLFIIIAFTVSYAGRYFGEETLPFAFKWNYLQLFLLSAFTLVGWVMGLYKDKIK